MADFGTGPREFSERGGLDPLGSAGGRRSAFGMGPLSPTSGGLATFTPPGGRTAGAAPPPPSRVTASGSGMSVIHGGPLAGTGGRPQPHARSLPVARYDPSAMPGSGPYVRSMPALPQARHATPGGTQHGGAPAGDGLAIGEGRRAGQPFPSAVGDAESQASFKRRQREARYNLVHASHVAEPSGTPAHASPSLPPQQQRVPEEAAADPGGRQPVAETRDRGSARFAVPGSAGDGPERLSHEGRARGRGSHARTRSSYSDAEGERGPRRGEADGVGGSGDCRSDSPASWGFGIRDDNTPEHDSIASDKRDWGAPGYAPRGGRTPSGTLTDGDDGASALRHPPRSHSAVSPHDTRHPHHLHHHRDHDREQSAAPDRRFEGRWRGSDDGRFSDGHGGIGTATEGADGFAWTDGPWDHRGGPASSPPHWANRVPRSRADAGAAPTWPRASLESGGETARPNPGPHPSRSTPSDVPPAHEKGRAPSWQHRPHPRERGWRAAAGGNGDPRYPDPCPPSSAGPYRPQAPDPVHLAGNAHSAHAAWRTSESPPWPVADSRAGKGTSSAASSNGAGPFLDGLAAAAEAPPTPEDVAERMLAGEAELSHQIDVLRSAVTSHGEVLVRHESSLARAHEVPTTGQWEARFKEVESLVRSMERTVTEARERSLLAASQNGALAGRLSRVSAKLRRVARSADAPPLHVPFWAFAQHDTEAYPCLPTDYRRRRRLYLRRRRARRRPAVSESGRTIDGPTANDGHDQSNGGGGGGGYAHSDSDDDKSDNDEYDDDDDDGDDHYDDDDRDETNANVEDGGDGGPTFTVMKVKAGSWYLVSHPVREDVDADDRPSLFLRLYVVHPSTGQQEAYWVKCIDVGRRRALLGHYSLRPPMPVVASPSAAASGNGAAERRPRSPPDPPSTKAERPRDPTANGTPVALDVLRADAAAAAKVSADTAADPGEHTAVGPTERSATRPNRHGKAVERGAAATAMNGLHPKREERTSMAPAGAVVIAPSHRPHSPSLASSSTRERRGTGRKQDHTARQHAGDVASLPGSITESRDDTTPDESDVASLAASG